MNTETVKLMLNQIRCAIVALVNHVAAGDTEIEGPREFLYFSLGEVAMTLKKLESFDKPPFETDPHLTNKLSTVKLIGLDIAPLTECFADPRMMDAVINGERARCLELQLCVYCDGEPLPGSCWCGYCTGAVNSGAFGRPKFTPKEERP